MSEKSPLQKSPLLRRIINKVRGDRQTSEEAKSNEVPMPSRSFFPWEEVHRHEDILGGGGAQWTDALRPGFNRDVSIEGTLDPAVQKQVTHALVRAALNGNQPGKLGKDMVTILDDGRVVAYQRYVLRGGQFELGMYVIDLNDKGDQDHYSESERATRFLRDMESVGDYEPNAKIRVNLMIDAMVNFYPEQKKKDDKDAA